MNTHEQPDSAEDKLDSLLASRPVKASPDFLEKTLARLKDEAAEDAMLDDLLAQHPVEAPPEFTARTLARIHESSAEEHDRKVIAFPRVASWVGAVAAAIVVGFFGLQILTRQPDPAGPGIAKDPVAPTEEATLVVAQDMPAVEEEMPGVEEYEAYAEYEALFVLAEDLDEADFIFEDNTMDALAAIMIQ